ncbi:MAG: hypothetical protein RSD82_07780, partial [Comamonas sp.]
MSKKLIALVATAVMVEGKRTVIQPGEELPDLSKHDERELVASGAAENPEDTAALAKQDARDREEAAKEFEEARAKVQEKQASIAAAANEEKPAGSDAAAGNE